MLTASCEHLLKRAPKVSFVRVCKFLLTQDESIFPLETLQIFLEGKRRDIAALNVLPWKEVVIDISGIIYADRRQQISAFVSQQKRAGLDVRVHAVYQVHAVIVLGMFTSRCLFSMAVFYIFVYCQFISRTGFYFDHAWCACIQLRGELRRKREGDLTSIPSRRVSCAGRRTRLFHDIHHRKARGRGRGKDGALKPGDGALPPHLTL